MAEFDQDNEIRATKEESAWFALPVNAKIVVADHIVYVEPETKFYRIALALARAFSLASLIAWFILLVLLIVLVFSMLNNLEVLQVMRGQEVFFQNTYGNHK